MILPDQSGIKRNIYKRRLNVLGYIGLMILKTIPVPTTTLLNKRHKILLADVKLLNTFEEDEKVALSFKPDHLHYKKISIERALAL